MRTPKVLTPLAAAALLLSSAAPAAAGVITVDDPAGDGQKGDRLDITQLRVSNRDHAVVTKVSFVKAAAGDLGIWLHARGTKRRDMVLVASRHRPERGDRNSVRSSEGEQKCNGLRVVWDHDADTALVRLPSKCFEDGDYGAVRFRVITEIGSDADWAPQESADAENDTPRWVWSDWTPRG